MLGNFTETVTDVFREGFIPQFSEQRFQVDLRLGEGGSGHLVAGGHLVHAAGRVQLGAP